MRKNLPLLLAAGALIIGSGCQREGAASSPPKPMAGSAWLQEVTKAGGVEFVHDPGATGGGAGSG